MRPLQVCIATGIYAPECGCKVHVQVGRGDEVPLCPRCRARVGWQFVQSIHIASMGSAIDMARLVSGPLPAERLGEVRAL